MSEVPVWKTDIHNWKLFVGLFGVKPIAQVLSLVPSIDQTKVTNVALDGSVYIQTIGNYREYADVSILVTLEEMREVNEVAARSDPVRIRYRDRYYYGYIDSMPQWQIVYPGELYSATIRLLYESDV